MLRVNQSVTVPGLSIARRVEVAWGVEKEEGPGDSASGPSGRARGTRREARAARARRVERWRRSGLTADRYGARRA